MPAFLKKLLGKLFPRIKYVRNVHSWAKTEREICILSELCRPDGIAVDIGANQGGYIWQLRPLVRLVIAFEPLPQMIAILRRNYGSKIQLESVILSDREGVGMLRYPAGGYERATVADSNTLAGTTGSIESRVAPMKTLDSFNFKNLSFIKIDVEGHEEAVLHGGINTLRREMPNLLIEIEERHSPGSLERVRALLEGIGYSGCYVDGNTILDISEFDLSRDQDVHNLSESGKTGKYINNFLFFPQEIARSIIERASRRLLKMS